MTTFVIDAFAWVEYFEGSALGEKVKEIVEDKGNTIFTSVITLAELSSFYGRKNKSFDEAQKILLSLCSIFPLSFEDAVECGTIHADMRKERKHIGLADCIVLHTARKVKGKIVTGDQDFRGMKDALMIK